MKLQPECIPCFLNQTLRALRFWNLERGLELIALREVLRVLSEEDYEKTPFQIACSTFGRLRKIASIEDPYVEVKRRQNQGALRLYPELKKRVFSSKDPFLEAIKLSVAGNLIDFGSPEGYKMTPERAIEISEEIKLAKSAVEDLRKDLSNAEEVIFFADNCGEIVFDKILLEVISQKFDVGSFKVFVRGGPILNDVTLKEAKEVGLDRIGRVELKTVSNGDPGTGPEINSEEVLEEIRNADVTISKGQANYEALGDFKGIYFMLVAKCDPVARELGVNVGDPVVWKRRKGSYFIFLHILFFVKFGGDVSVLAQVRRISFNA